MTMTQTQLRSRAWIMWLALVAVLLLAAFLRFWNLDSTPPGWRDDELINSLVISQHVLDGDLAVYYPDASGHEALYHAANALMLGLFGPGVVGIRWLSAILGVASIMLVFLVGRRLYGAVPGLVAAAGLAVSFWSLMYSRIGLRHISLPFLTLATYFFFLRGLGIGDQSTPERPQRTLDFVLAGLFMGLSFYTYFASRGVPLILLAFLGYALVFARPRVMRQWKQLLLMFGIGFLMAIPLLITLARQPESEARVAELAVPLVEARAGNFAPLQEHVLITLGMFHATGDDEWLYNIPGRPVFGPLGALVFWSGVIIALLSALRPAYDWLRGRGSASGYPENRQGWPAEASFSSAFVLLWWLAGISPGFISVPPASLGHTILAQPAVFLLASVPIWWLLQTFGDRYAWVAYAAAAMLVGSIALRDLPDYFFEWPQRGMTRFLYRADIRDVAEYLNDEPNLTDFGMSGLLAGPWDKIAFDIDLDDSRAGSVRARWYNPERAMILDPGLSFAGFPAVESPYAAYQSEASAADNAGGYDLMLTRGDVVPVAHVPSEPVCFENGLCWTGADYDPQGGWLELAWQVVEEIDMPDVPLISNPPPPGVYSGPRLLVFAQLQDTDGRFLVGDDGLWVDPRTMHPGDLFVQRHRLPAPEEAGGFSAVFGLYDPLTQTRILTLDGEDHVRLAVGE